MACNLTKGRTEPCKDTLGGLKAAYFVDYNDDDTTFTIVLGEVTAIDVITPAMVAFKFDLRADGNTFSQSMVSDKNTGTSVVTQTISLALKKLDKDTSLLVDLMSKGRPHIILQDRNDNYFLAGLTEGCDLTGSDISTGGARTDFNGYNLTFESMEATLSPTLAAAAVTSLLSVVDGTPLTP